MLCSECAWKRLGIFGGRRTKSLVLRRRQKSLSSSAKLLLNLAHPSPKQVYLSTIHIKAEPNKEVDASEHDPRTLNAAMLSPSWQGERYLPILQTLLPHLLQVIHRSRGHAKSLLGGLSL